MKQRSIKTLAAVMAAVAGLSMYSKPCNAWGGVPKEFKHVGDYLYEFNWKIPDMFMGRWIYNNEHKRGDVNADGVINAADATLILRCMNSVTYEHENRYMDVNCDKRIDAEDADIIQRYAIWRDTGIYIPPEED